MALHELYNAGPLSLSASSGAEDDGGCGQSAVRSAEQLLVLAHSDKIHRLSTRSTILPVPAHAAVSGGGGELPWGSGGGGGGSLDGVGSDRATEAEKVWLVLRALDCLQD
jgi:hypothetical protein